MNDLEIKEAWLKEVGKLPQYKLPAPKKASGKLSNFKQRQREIELKNLIEFNRKNFKDMTARQIAFILQVSISNVYTILKRENIKYKHEGRWVDK